MREYALLTIIPLPELMEGCMKSLFQRMRGISETGRLNKYDLLTTILIAIVDTDTKNYVSLCIGDGLLIVDGRRTEYDQDNQPDYLGYHLHDDFATYYASLVNTSHGRFEQTLALSTDGVFTFANAYDEHLSSATLRPLLNRIFSSTYQGPKHFQNTIDKVEEQVKLKATDDLGLVGWFQ